jgi:cell division protein FtsB
LNQEELYDEIEQTKSFTEKHFGLSLSKFIVIFSIVLFSGIYVGSLLYGTNSIQVYIKLDEYKEYLKGQITSLKQQNANKQKEYFELKEIAAPDNINKDN